MNHRLLSKLPSHEAAAIHRLTDLISAQLYDYFQIDSVFDPARFPATAFMSAAENPDLDVEVLQSMARVTVWIFTIDSVIDEKRLPEAELRRRLAVYEQIVKGERSRIDDGDSCGAVLLELCRLVRSKPLYPMLKDVWEETYSRMIRGMLFEAYDWKEPICLQQYLEHGLYSVGAPMYVVSGWILQSRDASFRHLDDLVRMMKLSATCIRLANDIRTFEKERLEHNLNALFIIENELVRQGLDKDAAGRSGFQFVSDLLRSNLEQFRALTDDGIPLKKALRRLTELSVDFYGAYDFHTVTASQLKSL